VWGAAEAYYTGVWSSLQLRCGEQPKSTVVLSKMQACESLEAFERAFQQRIARAALALNREAGDMTKEIWNYLEDLPEDLTEELLEEAAEAAVKRVEKDAAAAEARSVSNTRSGRSNVARDTGVLARRVEILEKALREGKDILTQRAARTAKTALAEVERSIIAAAAAEGWSNERRDQELGEQREPVGRLLKQALEGQAASALGRQAAAIAEWIKEAKEGLLGARERAEEVIGDKDSDYTQGEVEYLMQEFGVWNRRLEGFLTAGAANGFASNPVYEEAGAELREVQLRMRQATEWLCSVRTAATAGGASHQSPRRLITPPGGWLEREMSDLSIGSRGEPGSGATAMDIAAAGRSLAQAADGMRRMTESHAENSSKDWPKFDGKILNYAMWKKDWKRHHLDVYPSLTVDHLKRVLMTKCLPDDIKEDIRFKKTMEEVWEFLDTTFVKPNTFFHELMRPISMAKEVPEKDWKALEKNLKLLLCTFEQAREADMLGIVLHINTIQQMYEKWPYSEQVRWYSETDEVLPVDQPGVFMQYIKKRYRKVSTLAAQMAILHDSGRGGSGGGDSGNQRRRVVNAAAAATPTPPMARPHQQAGGQLRPCWMAGQGCTMSHPLGNCELFKQLSDEAKVAKLQEHGRCLYCFRHGANQECYARSDSNYKGCGLLGCKGHHQQDLHYVVETSRIWEAKP